MFADTDAFLVAYPEFSEAGEDLIAAKLTDAENRINQERYGDQAHEAHGLLTAHLLAQSHFGSSARLDPKSIKALGASTTYEREFLKLEATAACFIRTAEG